MTYTAEEVENLLAAGALKRIGMGSRRACYRLPDGRHCRFSERRFARHLRNWGIAQGGKP